MPTTAEAKNKFFKRLKSPSGGEAVEMSFIDHLEALRWHLVRGVAVWFVAFIAIFIKVDWVFDNIIYAPAKSSFVTYGWFCRLGNFIGVGDSLCMPAVEIPLQGNTISGPFMSAELLATFFWRLSLLISWQILASVLPALISTCLPLQTILIPLLP